MEQEMECLDSGCQVFIKWRHMSVQSKCSHLNPHFFHHVLESLGELLSVHQRSVSTQLRQGVQRFGEKTCSLTVRRNFSNNVVSGWLSAF